MSNFKIQNFIQASSVLMRIAQMMSNNTLKNQHQAFSELKKNLAGYKGSKYKQGSGYRLRVIEKRLAKLSNLSITGKLNNYRELNLERAFLRCKVRVDSNLKKICSQKFVIFARINDYVAMHRLRWLVQKSKLDSKSKVKGYTQHLEEFLDKMDGIKKEIYSKRNQLQNAFISIKRRHNYMKKVEEFEAKCRKIMKEKLVLQENFHKIKKHAAAKKMVLEKLLTAQNCKTKRGFANLMDNYRRYLQQRANLLSDNTILSSLNILEQKATKNVEDCLKYDNRKERGLERLHNMVCNKQNSDQTHAMNKIGYATSQHHNKAKNALGKLELIARDVFKTNLRKLRQNNSDSKGQILGNALNRLAKAQNCKLLQAFGTLSAKSFKPDEYKSFAMYLSELFKTKDYQNTQEGFRQIQSKAASKLNSKKQGVEKLHMIEKKIMERKNNAVSQIMMCAFKGQARKKKLEKLSKIVAKIMTRKQLQTGYEHLNKTSQDKKKAEKAINLLLEQMELSHSQKSRDALRRLVLNHVDEFKIPQMYPSLNMVSSKTAYRGLEEIISIARQLASW